MERAYTVQNLTQGWAPPPPDQGLGGDDRYDIYLMHSAFYGYTEAAGGKVGDNPMTPDVIEEDAYFSFIVLENDYNGFANTPLNNLRVTAAHEFNHALQYGYTAEQTFWLMEATATWIEDEVFDEIDDNYQFLPTYLDYPDICLPARAAGSKATHWYSDWIWLRWIAEHAGGPATIRHIWEHGRTLTDFAALAAALTDAGTSLPRAFTEFGTANLILDVCPNQAPYCYEEANNYPPVFVEGDVVYNGDVVTYTPPDGVQPFAADYIRLTVAGDRPLLARLDMRTSVSMRLITVTTNGLTVADALPADDPPGAEILLTPLPDAEFYLQIQNLAIPPTICRYTPYQLTLSEPSLISKMWLPLIHPHPQASGSQPPPGSGSASVGPSHPHFHDLQL